MGRLVAAGQWRPGDLEVLVVLDAGYDALRIAHLLAGLPVEILGRLRSDRMMRRPTPPRVYDPRAADCPSTVASFVLGDPSTWGTEQAVTTTDTWLYGQAKAQAWDRLHPRLTRRARSPSSPPPSSESNPRARHWSKSPGTSWAWTQPSTASPPGTSEPAARPCSTSPAASPAAWQARSGRRAKPGSGWGGCGGWSWRR
ncbi:transposase [Streptomyces sp. NPDC008343]|uniref:transposase n=1 Tax=Streptomyces sp. NPDC008343 TaxID=3364828 RepID=UPI0036EE1DEE